MVLTAALMNQWRDDLSYLKGAVSSYTPQIDQGATTNIAKTVTEARYTQVGDVCHVWAYLTLTGAGTAGSNITLTVPITASGHATGTTVGEGMFFDASVPDEMPASAHLVSTTQVALVVETSTNNYLGATPSVALAASDQLRVRLTYLVA
jgi:hypothetical protein